MRARFGGGCLCVSKKAGEVARAESSEAFFDVGDD
jgi:hypothetical protein